MNTYVGRGPWRVIDGVSVEVWQEAPGTDEVPAYAYHVTEGAAVRYAASLYREAAARLDACLEEWENEEAYTPEQYAYVYQWYIWAIEAEAWAQVHLLETARNRG